MINILKRYSLVIMFFLGAITNVLAQNTQQSFGRSRVQHKLLDWKMLVTTNFEIYYYQGGQELANYAAKYAESDFARMTELLGYTPYSKIKIFLYNSVNDLQQSNVGISTNESLSGGKTNFVKTRAEIPFTGTQAGFQRELRKGIAHLMVVEMMFGGSLKDMLQSSYLLTLPDWFMSGISSYAADGWSAEMDDYTRDLMFSKSNKLKRPAGLEGEEAAKVGHAIWNFIAEKYGKSNISNILNLTRIIRNEETSIASTIGLPYGQFLRECRNFYGSMAEPLKANYHESKEDFRVRNFKRRTYEYNQVKISPNGKFLAYTENRKGLYKVFVMDLKTKNKKVLLRGGEKVVEQRIDQTLPLIAWKSSVSLAVIYQKNAKNYLQLFDTQKKGISINFDLLGKKPNKKVMDFNQISDFSISEDGTTMALSADRKGQNDIYFYKFSSGKPEQITNDYYDDINPAFLKGSNTDIVFSSNRLSDTLSATDKGTFRDIKDGFDLFISRSKSKILDRIVYSHGNDVQPFSTDSKSIYYLSDETGIKELFRYDIAQKESEPVSDFLQGIQEYSVHPADSSIAYMMISKGHNFIGYSRKYNFNQSAEIVNTKRMTSMEEKGLVSYSDRSYKKKKNSDAKTKDTTSVSGIPVLVLGEGEVDTENYQFDADSKKQSNRPLKKQQNTTDLSNTKPVVSNTKKDDILIKGPYPYLNRFSTDNVITTAVIDPIRGLGIVATVSTNDLLEDHKFNAGASLFLNSFPKNNNVFFEYQYLKRKIDFGARFDRKTLFLNENSAVQKYAFNKWQVNAALPLNNSSRIVLTPFYANTRYIELSDLYKPDVTVNYAGAKIEYIFDNTTFNGLNMIKGTRAKVKFENYQGLNNKQTSFNNFTIDIRHYEPIHRDIIFATRIAYGQFQGAARKNYIFGGMDNWLFKQTENKSTTDNPLLAAQSGVNMTDKLFVEFVTPMRGFDYNKLYGNNFLLFNAEIRFPVIKYFIRSPITSNFFRNLQLVAFTDVGAAWRGKGLFSSNGPFGQESELNTIKKGGTGQGGTNMFSVSVINYRNPFLIGYGFGARTLLLGFYTKLDIAWGLEDFVTTGPKAYLTLGYDF